MKISIKILQRIQADTHNDNYFSSNDESKISDNVKKLYFKGKVFELLSLLFNVGKEMNIEQCPFLADDKNVKKIKKAKEIIISRCQSHLV